MPLRWRRASFNRVRLPLPHLRARGPGLRSSSWTRSVRRGRPTDSRTHRVHPGHPPSLPQGNRQGRGHSHRCLRGDCCLHLRQGGRRPLNILTLSINKFSTQISFYFHEVKKKKKKKKKKIFFQKKKKKKKKKKK